MTDETIKEFENKIFNLVNFALNIKNLNDHDTIKFVESAVNKTYYFDDSESYVRTIILDAITRLRKTMPGKQTTPKT